ncbi:MAG: homocysteine S-methyltransferase family protein [Thermoplasmatota archaeon]
MRNRTEIANLLKEKVLLLDGSYGAEFIRRSAGNVDVPDMLNITDPGMVGEIHRNYVEAGSDIILTNTFGATPVKLQASGIPDHREIVRAAVKIARSAAGDDTLIFGDIGPTGILPYPMGDGSFDLYHENYLKTARILIDEGVDGIMLETFTDILELKAACLAVRDISEDIFLAAMMTFDANGRTLTGTDPRIFAVTFNDLDVDAVGINCTLGPEEMVPIFQELSRFSDKYLIIEPNAGLPEILDGRTHYPVGPDRFSEFIETFWDLGANIMGGCCGTGPEHVRTMRDLIGKRPPSERDIETFPAVTSPSTMVNFDEFVIVGERINPAGRKKLREAMEGGDLNLIMDEASSQIEAGAKILDVNFGHESSVPADFMEKAVLAMTYNLGAPLSLDVQTPEVLGRLMKIYPGRPLVNSSTVKAGDMNIKFGYLSRYGGMIIVLAMGEDVPSTVEERIQNITKALSAVEDHGIGRNRILFDPIVLSMGAGNDPNNTLSTVRYLKNNNLLSICGLSNLSFGLPNRSFYNSSFLTMGIERGLTAAIMNPMDEVLMGMREAGLVISGRMEIPMAAAEEEMGLVKYLLEGRDGEALEITRTLLAEKDPMEVLQDELKPAMERIGVMYSKGEIFLPQLILAAQTSKPCFEHVENLLPPGSGKEVFVIATVKGDIHDIGKNIAAAVIRSSGYDVVDLGKDVPTDRIVEEVKERDPAALGLSAMMTTTAGRIGEIVTALRRAGSEVRVIAGGASLNERVVSDLGGDLYARDPVDAIEYLKTIKK